VGSFFAPYLCMQSRSIESSLRFKSWPKKGSRLPSAAIQILSLGICILLSPASAQAAKCGKLLLPRPSARQIGISEERGALIRHEGVFFARTDITRGALPNFLGPLALSYMNSNFLKGKTVLDAGCGGEGALVRDLRKDGVNAVGIDLQVRYAEFLFERDIRDTGFKKNTFDVIFSIKSLLYYASGKAMDEASLPEFRNALDELARIVIPNGLVILAPINLKYLSEKELFDGRKDFEIILTEDTPGSPSQKTFILRKVL